VGTKGTSGVTGDAGPGGTGGIGTIGGTDGCEGSGIICGDGDGGCIGIGGSGWVGSTGGCIDGIGSAGAIGLTSSLDRILFAKACLSVSLIDSIVAFILSFNLLFYLFGLLLIYKL
jgi:hypothetical protein